jgi:hypothetical protein
MSIGGSLPQSARHRLLLVEITYNHVTPLYSVSLFRGCLVSTSEAHGRHIDMTMDLYDLVKRFPEAVQFPKPLGASTLRRGLAASPIRFKNRDTATLGKGEERVAG